MTKMIDTGFDCAKCGNDIKRRDESFGGVGYAVNDKEEKICYACCAEADKEFMKEHGKNTLYLVKNDEKWEITNWPGTLVIRPTYVKKGHHNIARVRYDAWFKFDGYEWHGVSYGDNTQIIHCKRTKRKVA